jgi:hypothetical protein
MFYGSPFAVSLKFPQALQPVQKTAQLYAKRFEKRIIGSLAAHFANHRIERRLNVTKNGAYNGSTRQKRHHRFNGSNSSVTHCHCGNIDLFPAFCIEGSYSEKRSRSSNV